MNNIPIEEYFTYHPPATEERIQAHEAINNAALSFAKIIENTIQDEDCKKMAYYAIQQARMLANLGITIDELIQLKTKGEK